MQENVEVGRVRPESKLPSARVCVCISGAGSGLGETESAAQIGPESLWNASAWSPRLGTPLTEHECQKRKTQVIHKSSWGTSTSTLPEAGIRKMVDRMLLRAAGARQAWGWAVGPLLCPSRKMEFSEHQVQERVTGDSWTNLLPVVMTKSRNRHWQGVGGKRLWIPLKEHRPWPKLCKLSRGDHSMNLGSKCAVPA